MSLHAAGRERDSVTRIMLDASPAAAPALDTRSILDLSPANASARGPGGSTGRRGSNFRLPSGQDRASPGSGTAATGAVTVVLPTHFSVGTSPGSATSPAAVGSSSGGAGGGGSSIDLHRTDNPEVPLTGSPLASYQGGRGSLLGTSSKRTAWRCGLCNYCVTAMDQNGEPLPLSMSAFRKPLPMGCPRCGVEHVGWEPACPFDFLGDYANIRTRLSNSYVERTWPLSDAQPLGKDAAAGWRTLPRVLDRPIVTAPPPGSELLDASTSSETNAGDATGQVGKLPAILENIGKVTYRGGVAKPTFLTVTRAAPRRTAYYCGLCGRKLMRMDQNGELIPMDRSADGSIKPITCAGCLQCHADWEVRPFTM